MERSGRQVRREQTKSAGKLALGAKDSLAQIFHENTKHGPMTGRAYAAWIINFTRSHRAQLTSDQPYKTYSLMERRALPAVQAASELERTIAERRSIRDFSGAPLGLEELARLLFFTYGRTDPRGYFRAVASAGAVFPLELYVVALKVDGLEPGVYHYGVENGSLDVVKPGDHLDALKQVLAWDGIDLDNASLAIVMTAVFRRNSVKYLDRGYRMVLVEAGEAAQNLCLLATSMKLGACLLGGFRDDLLSDLLDVDGVDEAPLVPVLLGRPKSPPASGS
jgi:SagB-type dehydrogenase family enzyme